MATSSITHNFIISNPESVKRFVAAIEEAERDRAKAGTSWTSINGSTRNLSFNGEEKEVRF